MPLYEYKCQSCGSLHDVLTPYDQRDTTRACPECDRPCVRIKFSRSSFILKGGGWYRDGYQKK